MKQIRTLKVTVLPEARGAFQLFVLEAGLVYEPVIEPPCGQTEPVPCRYLVSGFAPEALAVTERTLYNIPGVVHVARDTKGEFVISAPRSDKT